MRKIFSVLLITLAVFLLIIPSIAKAAESTCLTYFTGIGCPHCAKTDPVVLNEYLEKNKNLTIIEYEIYQLRENAPLLEKYSNKYNSGLGIPLLIFDKGTHLRGDKPIINNLDETLEKEKGNLCPTLEGKKKLSELDFTELRGKPKIWTGDRILIKEEDGSSSNQVLHKLLNDNIKSVLNKTKYTKVEPKKVPLSGSSIEFAKAVKVDNWRIQWMKGNNSKQGQNEKPESNTSSRWTMIPMASLLMVIGTIITWGIKR